MGREPKLENDEYHKYIHTHIGIARKVDFKVSEEVPLFMTAVAEELLSLSLS